MRPTRPDCDHDCDYAIGSGRAQCQRLLSTLLVSEEQRGWPADPPTLVRNVGRDEAQPRCGLGKPRPRLPHSVGQIDDRHLPTEATSTARTIQSGAFFSVDVSIVQNESNHDVRVSLAASATRRPNRRGRATSRHWHGNQGLDDSSCKGARRRNNPSRAPE